ncbi:MAG: hypothetical protein Q8P84_03745 [Deltaproteobacteria bacterium]|nr:hypothetical protein [Deltaproteobacteria bacterium]
MPKKKLLISFSPTTLDEAIFPLLPELAKEFRIIVTAVDHFPQSGFFEKISVLEKKGVIEKFFYILNHTQAQKLLIFLKRKLYCLKEYCFDAWLSLGEWTLENRYISECLLPEKCVRVVFWHDPTYLFHNEGLIQRLLSSSEECSSLSFAPKISTHRRLFEKIVKAGSLSVIFFKSVRLGRIYVKRGVNRLKAKWIDRVVLPWFIVGKTFKQGTYDRLSPLNPGKAKVLIFCDGLEAQAHKALFETPEVYVAQYPTYGFCRCDGDKNKKDALLIPLSGFIRQKSIAEEYLRLFHRDLNIVLENTGIKDVHLRMHPGETTTWYRQLTDYLLARGIQASVVGCEKPIREVVCDYKGIAGFGSCSFRNGRASCNHVFVVGFEAVSKFAHANPKFRFGRGEGIEWINEDGSYDPNIFKKLKFDFPERKTVPVILKELMEKRVSS